MRESWIKEELNRLNTNRATLTNVPNNIGQIVYCDTTEPRQYSYSDAELLSGRIKAVAIVGSLILAIAVLTYCDSLFWFEPRWLVSIIWSALFFGTGAVLIFYPWRKLRGKFGGTDYFVGDKGFAFFEFEKSRDNVLKHTAIMFDEMDAFFCTEETIPSNGDEADETIYTFAIYKKADSERIHECKIYTTKMTQFMHAIELQWTKYLLEKTQNQMTHTFPIRNIDSNKTIEYDDMVTVGSDYIEINEEKHNSQNTKRFYVTTRELPGYGINRRPALVIEKEDSTKIFLPLFKVGNTSAMLVHLFKFAPAKRQIQFGAFKIKL